MNVLESLRTALRGLWSNRLRSALTMLGIIIGVAAVIVLVSIGKGVERYIVDQFQSLGSNLLFILSSSSSTNTEGKPLTMGDAKAMADPFQVPSVAAVAPVFVANATVVYGRASVRVSVDGVTPSYQQVRNWYPVDGRFIEDADVEAASRVAVVGQTTVEDLFGTDVYPIGQTIRIESLPFRVVGVMQERGGSSFGDEDAVVFVPISTAQTRLRQARTRDGDYRVSGIFAQAISEDRMETAKRELEALLRERHSITFRGEDDFSVFSQNDILSAVGQVTGVLTVFLGVIAGISLLVGGIGIMNIMLVSVTERTREIGLRKAVGAKYRDILMQFLIESVVMAITGGAVGIALGWTGAAIGSALIPDLELVVTPDAVSLATTVSALIGVFFGIYPASRAASLNPIDALRYE